MNYERQHEQVNYEDFVRDEMEAHKKEVLSRLSDVIHPLYIQQFVNILVEAWEYDFKDANTLVKEFDLNQKDFAAIKGDYVKFETILSNELEEYRESIYA